MDYAKMGQICVVLVVVVWFYAAILKKAVQNEIEADEQAPLKLTRNVVRYDRRDLREPNDSPWMDQSEWDDRPAA